MSELSFPVFISLVAFRFNEESPEKLQIGLNIDHTTSLLKLPSISWNGKSDLRAMAEYLLRQTAHADVKWLGVEDVGVISSNGIINTIWRTYIPDTIEVNQQLEWIPYDRIERECYRIVREDLTAIRRAFNR